jgi:hypothetical protein
MTGGYGDNLPLRSAIEAMARNMSIKDLSEEEVAMVGRSLAQALGGSTISDDEFWAIVTMEPLGSEHRRGRIKAIMCMILPSGSREIRLSPAAKEMPRLNMVLSASAIPAPRRAAICDLYAATLLALHATRTQTQ